MSVSQGSEAILEALKLSCSQNPEELKKGEEKLKNWEREAGFYSELAVSVHHAMPWIWCACKLACFPLQNVLPLYKVDLQRKGPSYCSILHASLAPP